MASPEVDRWFVERNPRMSEPMRRVREVILGADPRIEERIQYRTPTFSYRGDLAAFVGLDKPVVTLMFNRGARIPGDFPHLEGSGPTARFMRFASLSEVDERSDELAAIVRAWCELGSAEAD